MRSVEDTVKMFLTALRDKNIDKLTEFCQITWASNLSDPGRKVWLETLIERVPINKFKIIKVNLVTEIMVDALVSIDHRKPENMRLIQEIAPYHPSKKGVWGVNPISALKLAK